jgi:hypothetical protein
VRPVLIVVGADKGGVGKTTVCRALLDYLDEKKITSIRVFDTQRGGDLQKYRLGVEVVDISSIDDQMRVFDGVEDYQATVIDICAGQLSPSLAMLESGGLLRDVGTGVLRMLMLHVIGSSIASMEEIGEVVAVIGGGAVRHLLVKNHYNDAKFRAALDPKYAGVLAAAARSTIEIPLLPSQVREEIDAQLSGYANFIKSVNLIGEPLARRNSRMLVGYAARWLSAVWSEFDRVNLMGTFDAA